MSVLELPWLERKPLKIPDATGLHFDKGIFRLLFTVGAVLILLTITNTISLCCQNRK